MMNLQLPYSVRNRLLTLSCDTGVITDVDKNGKVTGTHNMYDGDVKAACKSNKGLKSKPIVAKTTKDLFKALAKYDDLFYLTHGGNGEVMMPEGNYVPASSLGVFKAKVIVGSCYGASIQAGGGVKAVQPNQKGTANPGQVLQQGLGQLQQQMNP